MASGPYEDLFSFISLFAICAEGEHDGDDGGHQREQELFHGAARLQVLGEMYFHVHNSIFLQ